MKTAAVPMLALCMLAGCASSQKSAYQFDGLDPAADFAEGYDSCGVLEKPSGWGWAQKPITAQGAGPRLKISYAAWKGWDVSLYDSSGAATYDVTAALKREGPERVERISWRFLFKRGPGKDSAGYFLYVLGSDHITPVFKGSLDGDSLSIEWRGRRSDGSPFTYAELLQFWSYTRLLPFLKFKGYESLRFARGDTTLALVVPRDPRWSFQPEVKYTAYFRKDLPVAGRVRVLELLPVYNQAIRADMKETE
jgi:hypothetical protein